MWQAFTLVFKLVWLCVSVFDAGTGALIRFECVGTATAVPISPNLPRLWTLPNTDFPTALFIRKESSEIATISMLIMILHIVLCHQSYYFVLNVSEINRRPWTQVRGTNQASTCPPRFVKRVQWFSWDTISRSGTLRYKVSSTCLLLIITAGNNFAKPAYMNNY